MKKKCGFLLRNAVLGLAFLPSFASAVGFGDLSVNSKLGEPLDIEIRLLSVTPTELGTLEIGLGSRADFQRANIAYPANAALVRFDIIEDDNGEYYISATTEDAVNEPFLHFLMAASWSGGKVVREYTALLDPPLYSGQAGAVVEVPTVVSQDEPTDDIQLSGSGTVTSATSTAGTGAAGVPGTVSVQRGDTLSGIVSRLGLTDSVTLYQALSAMLEANPDAFVDGNMNRLKAGASLTVPDISSISQVSRSGAISEFQSQVAEYNQYLVDIGYSAPGSDAGSSSIAEESEPEPAPAATLAESETSPDLAETTIEPEAPAVVTEPEVGVEPQPEIPTEIEVGEPEVAALPELEPVEPEAELSIGQEATQEEIDSAIGGAEGDEAQVEALKAQLAELDESLLASGVESEEVKNRLAEIQTRSTGSQG